MAVNEKKAATDALLEDMGVQRGLATIEQEKAAKEKVKANAAAEEAGAIQEQAEACSSDSEQKCTG